MTRRSLIQSLIAGVAAKFARKAKFESGAAVAHAWKEEGHLFYRLPWTVEQQIRYNVTVGTGYCEDILAGCYDSDSDDQSRQCAPIDRLSEALEAAREKLGPLPKFDSATVDYAYLEVNKMLDRWNSDPFHRDAT